jgi:zinc D-Ala-D-Ala dipeptidase
LKRMSLKCHDCHMTSCDQSDAMDIILMADPLVAGTPVADNGEVLVDVRTRGFCVSARLADSAGAFAHLRSGVVDRLDAAADALPAGLRLLIIEGYRPPRLQSEYFDNYLSSLRSSRPNDDQDELRMLASRYVSPPEIAPHSAGAAVDLTLCTEDGHELDLGTSVNANPEESNGACYTGHPSVGGDARRNRAILGAALGGAGLVNYPTEWWHWSYGDRYWAMTTGAPTAIYGTRQLR